MLKSNQKILRDIYVVLYTPKWRGLRWGSIISLIFVVLYMCKANMTGKDLTMTWMVDHFNAYVPPEETETGKDACDEVNRIEQRVDDAMTNSKEAVVIQELQAYSFVLRRFRTTMMRYHGGETVRCRTDKLAQIVHEEGKHVTGKWSSSNINDPNATWGQYEQLMKGLVGDLGNANKCERFWTVAPWIWQWCNSGDFRLLDQNPEVTDKLANGLRQGAYYGNPAVRKIEVGGHGTQKRERIQHSQHLMILQIVGNANVGSDLDQIVEFGGGTGDMAATLRDNGFGGMYVIYDMEPMTLLELYWLRYSGHAAFLGKHIRMTPKIRKNAIVIQPAEDTEGFRSILLHESHLLRSAFLSFWAFNEADKDAREKIRPDIQMFGRMVLAIRIAADGNYGWKDGKGVDVLKYFENFVNNELLKTHNTCMWRFVDDGKKFPAGSYYFVANRRELPPPRCLESLNCFSTSKHPTIKSTC